MSEGFRKHAIAVRISREMALMQGLVEPTPEEQAEMDARSREYDAKSRAAWVIYDGARASLDAITEQPARAVLDLHRWTQVESPTCEGCDGYEDQPEWPCRTTRAVAAHYGITLPESGSYLWRRP